MRKTFTYFSIIFLLSFAVSYTSSAQFFQEVAQDLGINHIAVEPGYVIAGVAVFDYNNDGWEDVYLTGGVFRDKLYKNEGNGTFTEVGLSVGLAETENILTTGVTTGDIDNDGDRDIFVSTGVEATCLLYLNNGNGSFQNISVTAKILEESYSMSATFGDYNQDGYLDIYVANYVENSAFTYDNDGTVNGFAHECYPNFLYLNNKDNTFTESSQVYGVNQEGCGLVSIFTDYDNDNDLDLYVGNDFGEFVLPNVVYESKHPLDEFEEDLVAGLDIGLYCMGIATGDYNEDGLLDYYLTNIGKNYLMKNNGNGSFTDVSASAGVENETVDGMLLTVSWGCAFMDYDNDTDIDLFVSNGNIPTAAFIASHPKDPNKLFENDGNGNFTDVSIAAGVDNTTRSRGMAYVDYDQDGDLDIFVAVAEKNGSTSDRALVYRNEVGNTKNWLQVKLEGAISNKDAFGSKVKVKIDGRTLVREIQGGGGSYQSQHSSIAHFGLGSYDTVDEVEVIWPNGEAQTLYNVDVNQKITIKEVFARPKVEGNNIEITHQDSSPSLENGTDLGVLEVGETPLSSTFVITNTGNKVLHLNTDPVSLTGIDADKFELTQPSVLNLEPGESTMFEISFNSLIEGLYEAQVSIESNALIFNPYLFNIQASVVNSNLFSSINIKGNNISISNHDNSPSIEDNTDFGEFELGNSPISQVFIIENRGTIDLELTATPSIEILGPHANDFEIVTFPSTTVEPSSNTAFVVRLTPTLSGLKFARINIPNNDNIRNPFYFDIQANVLSLPKITVKANGYTISNNESEPSLEKLTDFGSANQGEFVPKVHSFVIKNVGTADLKLTSNPSVGIFGEHFKDFVVTSNAGQTIPTGESSMFEIAFIPQAEGLREAKVIIANNDSDQQPFVFDIKGIGLEKVVTANEAHISRQISIYPNPNKGYFYIDNQYGTVINYEITDLNGKKISEGKAREEVQKIDITHLNAGMYLLKIRSDSGNLIKKIIKH